MLPEQSLESVPLLITPENQNKARSLKQEFPGSNLFCFCGLLNLAFIYAKISVKLYVKWTYAFLPMIIFFVIKLLESLLKIKNLKNLMKQNLSPIEMKLKAMWVVTQLLISGTLAVGTLYLGDLIEKETISRDQKEANQERSEQIDLVDPLKHLFFTFVFALLVYLVYSMASNSLIQQLDEDEENEKTNIGQVIMNFIFSILGNSVSFCSGGACNSFYISTFSAFFSAFGIPFASFIHYLNFFCVFLLIFSLISLYSVKYSWKYGPFILTFFGAVMILSDMFVYDLNVINYVGNGLIILAAIWNSKINKFRFGGGTKRK